VNLYSREGAGIQANGRAVVLKLRTPDYKSLPLIGADAFSCAWNDRAVSVNYKPGGGQTPLFKPWAMVNWTNHSRERVFRSSRYYSNGISTSA
jgi:hypothetical protein